MKNKYFVLFGLCLFLTGCATTIQKSSSFDESIPKIHTIAVLPVDVEVYRLTAGGVRELMDQWSDEAKKLIQDSLQKNFAKQYGFDMKFVEEDWLKTNHRDLWYQNRALYNTVAVSAMAHSYPGDNAFKTKIKNFDYTLGSDVGELAAYCSSDALLFIYGFDHEATAGRQVVAFWNLALSVAIGTPMLTPNPTLLVIGLVDAKTGDLLWFKTTPQSSEYNYRNPKEMDNLIKWFAKDFLTKK